MSVAISLALHVALVFFLLHKPAAREQTELMSVDVVFEPRLPPAPVQPQHEINKQIVTPTEQPESKPPEATRFLSDRDMSAESESIKRGDGMDAAPVTGGDRGARGNKAPTKIKPVEAKPPQKAARPVEKQLEEAPPQPPAKLDLSPSYDALNKITTSAQQQKNAALTQQTASAVEPFSRAPGSGARFTGFTGTTDFIPDLKDGDITLLNAKADKFAVFVRRVATQVFNHLREEGWQNLSASDVRSIRGYTTFRAVLSKQGKLLSVSLEAPSGLGSFDNVVKSAVQKGAQDPHPPQDARAADGTFRFIFMARTWTKTYGNPRTGAPTEARWLILKTGLE